MYTVLRTTWEPAELTKLKCECVLEVSSPRPTHSSAMVPEGCTVPIERVSGYLGILARFGISLSSDLK